MAQPEEARRAFETALDHLPSGDRLWRSRLYRRIAGTWDAQWRFEEAREAQDRAEAVLGREPEGDASRWWQEWIEVQMSRMNTAYWCGDLDTATALIDRTRPVVEQYGDRGHRERLTGQGVNVALRRERYVPSDGTMAQVRARGSDASIGFFHLCRRELDAAELYLQAGLASARRRRDPRGEAMCLSYLTILRRERGDVEAVREILPHSHAAGEAGGQPAYVVAAEANRAWLAWRDGDLAGAEARGHAALAIGRSVPAGYPFLWLALWPLMGVALAGGRLAECIEHARALLHSVQQRLPEAVASPVEAALAAWDAGDAEAARAHLEQALPCARSMGYL
jgi:hypothetical protein